MALALERRLPLVVASFEELDTLFDRAGEVEAHAQSAPTDVVEENKPLALSESIETLQIWHAALRSCGCSIVCWNERSSSVQPTFIWRPSASS